MKRPQITLIFITLTFLSLRSQPIPISAFTPEKIKNNNLLTENSFATTDFYGNNNGAVHLLMSNEYVGSSLSYFPKTNTRLQYGMNVGIIPMVKNNNTPSDYYLRGNEDRLLLIPFMLSLKIRLKTSYDDKLIPYIIGGLGPTLGLDLGPYNRFFDSIAHLNGELGGGGYVGFGIDYLWAEDWAFSTDIRYNLYMFDHPVGDEREFSGFSFFVGFARAFGL